MPYYDGLVDNLNTLCYFDRCLCGPRIYPFGSSFKYNWYNDANFPYTIFINDDSIWWNSWGNARVIQGPFGGTAYEGPRGGITYEGPFGNEVTRGPRGNIAVARGPRGNIAVGRRY